MNQPEPSKELPEIDIDALRHVRLKQILILLTVAIVLSAIPYLVIGEWFVAGCLAAMLAAVGMCGLLDKTGHTERGSLLLLLSMFVMTAVLAWRSEGLHDSTILIFPTILVIAALLVGRVAYIALSALIVGYVVVLTLATDWGWRENGHSTGELFFARDLLVILAVLGLTVRLISNDLQKLLRMLRRRISQLEVTKRELAHLSQHDGLTGLPNRIMGAGRITQAIKQAERHGSKVAILFIDIDNFKSVNDMLGHAAGDVLLKATAERITAAVRHSDIVSRHGGDEFVLGLTDLSDGTVAGEIADTILAELNRPILLDGQEISTGGSIGIAIYPDDATDYDELVSLADIAMYQAKDSGRNLVCFYEADMNQASQESRRLVPELRQALARGEFSLRYQPVYELKGQTLVGVEALVRWQHPKRGELSPTLFIPAAEKSGLIVELGEWVLREALAQMARPGPSHAFRRGQSVAGPVSPRQCRDDGGNSAGRQRRAGSLSGIGNHRDGPAQGCRTIPRRAEAAEKPRRFGGDR
jgi:diguanylate cyclase (GGDEF)-like protein